MKCIVLAGGSGDALWPLSRKNYPKQFIYIKEGRSLFQEAIARNLPFCDEFIIFTNEKYRNIVKGQLQAFQGLNYQCFLEQKGRQTGPAVAIACMCLQEDEEILVVSTDHMIGEGNYNAAILQAKERLTDTNAVVIGCNIEEGEDRFEKGHNYFLHEDDKVVGFIERGMIHAKNVLLDSGIFLMRCGTYLQAIKFNEPALYDRCFNSTGRLIPYDDWMVIPEEFLDKLIPVSVGQAIFSHWAAAERISIVRADFKWSRILSTEVLAEFAKFDEGDVILENSQNVSVINEKKNSLVVGNGLEDVLIVNTKDAVYISKKGKSADIKNIMNRHYMEQKEIFDEGDIFYTEWGIKETLIRNKSFMVKMITIFPGRFLRYHMHEKRSEHWSIVSGRAMITIDDVLKEYGTNESIYVPCGVFHKISNEGAEDLVLIEVSTGESVSEPSSDMVTQSEGVVRLRPAFKHYLWGGSRLKEIFSKRADSDIIAESWELSAHEAGQSVVSEGRYAGMNLSRYIEERGKDILGWKCQPYEMFPLLIKFIDAQERLSIQVHPGDEYAMQVEGEYGKNEMWYILEANEGAFVYLGFNKEMTKEECLERIEEGNLEDVLRKVPVSKGDVIFVETGTIHAINEGVLVLEVQQSSNATYRLYDYNRLDSDGRRRELHLQKALTNINLSESHVEVSPRGDIESFKKYKKQMLGQCKYFSTLLYEVYEEAEINFDDSSFASIVFLEGEGQIFVENRNISFNKGDSFFVEAGKRVLKIKGNSKFVVCHI